MTIQVNPIISPRIIVIPEADGNSITIQSLVNQIRDWEDDQANLAYPRLLSATGKDDLGGGLFVGITAVLENTKVKFEDRSGPDWVRCRVTGGNLIAVDANNQAIDPIEPSAYTSPGEQVGVSATILNLDTMQTDLAFIKQIEQGRWKITNNQMVFYGADGITPIRTFGLKNAQGNSTQTDVYERVPV